MVGAARTRPYCHPDQRRAPGDTKRSQRPRSERCPAAAGSSVSDDYQTTSHEIERYAGLFAKRTRQMRSSAMRDLMAITARPEVISLAGGLPDTSTFPSETFAAIMDRIARESCASALQYGPTEGFDETKACIAQVMAEEGMRV